DDSLSTAIELYDNPAPAGPGTARSATISVSQMANVAALGASMGSGGSAGAVAAAVAAAQTALLGGGASHLLDGDQLPYSRAAGVMGGNVIIDLSAILPGPPLNQGRLLQLAAAGATGTVFADRQTGADPATADDDSIVASANRTLTTGNADLFLLPGGALPSLGWGGYLIRVSNWSSSATAAAGPSATAAGTTASQAGTLSYWDGTGYTNVDLATSSVSNLTVGVSASFSGCGYTMSAQLNGGGSETAVEYENGDPTKPIRTARSVVNAPAWGTATYSVNCLGIDVANLSVNFSFGRTLAEAHFSVPGA
ncbi:MAG TPA: hypothetical protein VI854_09850, partial [Acidimicrobiia bacterium]|nr:hypothetical protein [Acidimicrobiia bacterium]